MFHKSDHSQQSLIGEHRIYFRHLRKNETLCFHLWLPLTKKVTVKLHQQRDSPLSEYMSHLVVYMCKPCMSVLPPKVALGNWWRTQTGPSTPLTYQVHFVKLLRFLGPGTIWRGVLWHGTVAHARAQARICNVDITYYTIERHPYRFLFEQNLLLRAARLTDSHHFAWSINLQKWEGCFRTRRL